MPSSNTMMQNQDPRISHASANGILTVRLKGRVDLDLMTKHITQHSGVWVQHACILWDTLQLDLSGVTADEVMKLPDSSRQLTKLRAGGRTAVLAQKEFELIAKFIVAEFESQDSPVEFRTFLHEEDALAWLRAI